MSGPHKAVCNIFIQLANYTVWPKAIVSPLLVRSHKYCSFRFHQGAFIILLLFIIYNIGNQDGGNDFFGFEYGLQVFDLCADQICRLMEKPSMNKGKNLPCNVCIIREDDTSYVRPIEVLFNIDVSVYTCSYRTWGHSSNTVQCYGWRALLSNGFQRG